MPRNRKYFPNKEVLFITTRTEEGLPMVASHILDFIIWGILARAKCLYSIRTCHFSFMANHFHLLAVVDCPQDISNFMSYVKGEIAHAINLLLGRRQKTVWQDGYDSPICLTAETVTKYIKYIYENPSIAGLVDSIEDYPGVSSWGMFSTNCLVKTCPRLPRKEIPTLHSAALSVNEQKRYVALFEKLDLEQHDFILEPDAWRERFPNAASNEEIIAEIQQSEAKRKIERKNSGKEVMGATALRRESMLKEHTPKKWSKRMICLCNDLELRKAFIETFKHLAVLASEAYQRWKCGDFGALIPPGMFCPRRPDMASALSAF